MAWFPTTGLDPMIVRAWSTSCTSTCCRA